MKQGGKPFLKVFPASLLSGAERTSFLLRVSNKLIGNQLRAMPAPANQQHQSLLLSDKEQSILRFWKQQYTVIYRYISV